MLEVTPDALVFSWRVLQRSQVPEGITMRLCRGDESRLELVPDKQGGDDQGFEFEGRTVLIVDKTLGDRLTGQRLVVRDTGPGEAVLQIERISGQESL